MMRRSLPLVIVILLAATLAGAADAPARAVVNVNTATAEQLQLLPRVGPALAGRIIAFREANGAFASPHELIAVQGIGERSLELLAPYVVVKGDTTLTEKVKVPRTRAS